MRFHILLSLLSPSRINAFQLQPPPRYTKSTSTPTLSSSYDYNYAETSPPSIHIEENTYRDIDSLTQWAEEAGVQKAPGLEVTPSFFESEYEADSDYEAMTTEDLPSGSSVLYVPQYLILSSNAAMAELRCEEMYEAEQRLIYEEGDEEKSSDMIRHYYLIYKILLEYEKGQESPWYAWLNSMPRYYSNAASMTSFCFTCVPALMRKLAMEERSILKKNHLAIMNTPYLSDETKRSAALWTFAHQIVYTRAFEADDGSGDLRIVPMGDYFNHGTEADVSFAYDEEGNYWAQTIRDVPAGSPLRIQYADPTNPSFLFARYGFLDESSPATFCKIFPPQVNRDMVELGYAQNRMLFYKDTGDVSQEVWDILLYQWLTSSNVADRRILMEAHNRGDVERKMALHESYYPKTSSLLEEHLNTFMEQLDRLGGKADGKDPMEHPRLPLILSHNEFVRRTFLMVRNRYFGY